MGFILTLLTAIATLVALSLGALYILFKYNYAYWEKRKVPHLKPSIPLGNMSFSVSFTESMERLYREKRLEPYFGLWMMHKPAIMINDPDLIKKVLVQDFSNFADHGNYVNIQDDPLQNHLFSTEGAQWKNLRAKLSTTFSSGKMKTMFPILEEVSQNLVKALKPLAEKNEEAEMKDWIGRYAMDSIGSCAFGIDVKSIENPDSEFRAMGKRIFLPTWNNLCRNLLGFLVPDFAKLIKLVQTDRMLSKFFLGVVKDTIDYRQKNSVKRNDFLQLLMGLMEKGVKDVNNKESEDGEAFSFNDAAANAFVFLLGGYETTSSALQFTIFELAKNQEIQEKLRKEILSEMQKNDGKLTYEGVFNIKYLGMVLDESQRLYTLASILMRECNKDYKIPGTDHVIEKGTRVLVCPSGLHQDERYYENPKVFDPERFTDEAKGRRNNYTYLPFGDGPRNCIGNRFALMQMRIALCALVSNFRITLGKNMPEKLVMSPKHLVLTPEGGINLKLTLI